MLTSISNRSLQIPSSDQGHLCQLAIAKKRMHISSLVKFYIRFSSNALNLGQLLTLIQMNFVHRLIRAKSKAVINKDIPRIHSQSMSLSPPPGEGSAASQFVPSLFY